MNARTRISATSPRAAASPAKLASLYATARDQIADIREYRELGWTNLELLALASLRCTRVNIQIHRGWLREKAVSQ